LVSSFADSAVSQPQYMKIDSESAVVRTENDVTENGLSHDHSKSIAVLASPLSAFTMATTVKRASAAILDPDEHVHHALGGRHPAVGEVRRDRDERKAGRDVRRLAVAPGRDVRVAGDLGDEEVEERDGHAGQVRQHDDDRDDEAPAAHPPGVWAECLDRPRERGPASGATLFSSRYADAASSIGTKPTMKIAGAWTPTSVTVRPSVAVSA
jgi:hypothetical protein